MSSGQKDLDLFLHSLNTFWRTCTAEYVPAAKRCVITILYDVYDHDKPEALAMEEILWYLAGAFPKQVEELNEMEQICRRAIRQLEAT